MKPMRYHLALAAVLSVGLLTTQLKAEDQQNSAQPGAAEQPQTGRVSAKLDAQNYKSHIVKAGDSLWELAKSNGVEYTELYQLNRGHLRNPSRIQPGDKIYFPPVLDRKSVV